MIELLVCAWTVMVAYAPELLWISSPFMLSVWIVYWIEDSNYA